MLRFSAFKILSILLVLIIGGFYALPNILSPTQRQAVSESIWPLPTQPVTLGLDLQGGCYMLLEVDLLDLQNERLQSVGDQVAKTFRERPRITI